MVQTLKDYIKARGGRWSWAGRNALEHICRLESDGDLPKGLPYFLAAKRLIDEDDAALKEWVRDSGVQVNDLIGEPEEVCEGECDGECPSCREAAIAAAEAMMDSEREPKI